MKLVSSLGNLQSPPNESGCFMSSSHNLRQTAYAMFQKREHLSDPQINNLNASIEQFSCHTPELSFFHPVLFIVGTRDVSLF